MRINTEKFKEFLEDEVKGRLKACTESTKARNFIGAFENDIEHGIFEYLLTAWDDPDEFDWMEDGE